MDGGAVGDHHHLVGIAMAAHRVVAAAVGDVDHQPLGLVAVAVEGRARLGPAERPACGGPGLAAAGSQVAVLKLYRR